MTIDLVGAELSRVETDELEAGICGFQARLSAATAVYVLAVAEYDRRQAWESWECRSMAHFLAWKCGTGLVAAREQVRVGGALSGLPVTRDRFCAGVLSYSQVRAITRVATAETDQLLADLAEVMTASQLEDVVRAYRRSGRIEDDTAEKRRARRRVSWHWDDDGMLVGRFCLPAEEGAVVAKAIDALVTPADVAAADQEGAADGWGAARADALVAMAEDHLAGAEVDDGGDDRITVNVLVDEATLLDPDTPGEGICQVDDGPGLSPTTVRRLACDASTVTMTRRADGTVLDVGRRTRRIGRRLRRALRVRDRGCRFPGCTARRTQAHHITHWVDGGATDMDNLVSLCGRHHHRHHEGGYRIEQRPGELTFVRADGRVIADRPTGPGPCRPGGQLHETIRPFHCDWEGDAVPMADVLTILHQADGTLDPADPLPHHRDVSAETSTTAAAGAG